MEKIVKAEVIRWEEGQWGVAIDFEGKRYEAYRVGDHKAAQREIERRKALNQAA